MVDEGLPFRIFDHVLELSVIGSWSNLGYRLRRASARHWGSPAPFGGRRVLVTGGTRGIGRAVALGCAQQGARVGIVGRDADRARQAADDLAEQCGAAVWSAGADLADLAQVDRLADAVRDWAAGDLGVLVHCAGSLWDRWQTAPSGIEMTVATHVIGPHLLTSRLEHQFRHPRSAVIWMSSGGMYAQPLVVDSLDMTPDRFRGTVAYARAKRAQVVLAALWDRRLGPRTRSFAMHPGWVDTKALREGLPRFARLMAPLLRTPAQGADTAVWLGAGGASLDAPPAFWLDRRARPVSRWPGPRAQAGEAEGLWAWCQQHAGLDQWRVGS